MPVPDDFNSVKHFQDTLRRLHNKQVRDYFSDVGGDEWELDISTTRASLRAACTIDDNDTLTQCLYRYIFFHISVRRGEEFTEPVYGIPVGSFQQTRKFKPQIKLIFKEDREDVYPDYSPLTAEYTCRLMDVDSDTITQTKINQIALKIKQEFTSAGGYRFHKGKTLVTYYEPNKGYSLQVYAYSVAEGREIINKILNIQNHTPDWQNSTVNENQEPSQAYPTIPQTKTILGKSTRLPRKRPVGYVRFQYALLHLWGKDKAIPLCDRVYRFLDPIERSL